MRSASLSTVLLISTLSFTVASPQAHAGLVGNGTFTIDTVTGYKWLDLTQTQDMSFLEVSAQLGPGGRFAGYRYATVSEVEMLWADAGLSGSSLPCSPQPLCFAENIPDTAARQFVNLLGNTWPPSYGFLGNIALTSTPYDPPWPGCVGQPYICYLTPEVRIYSDIPDEALVVEALRDYIADPAYASWLVSTPEPNLFLPLVSVCLAIVRQVAGAGGRSRQ